MGTFLLLCFLASLALNAYLLLTRRAAARKLLAPGSSSVKVRRDSDEAKRRRAMRLPENSSSVPLELPFRGQS
jgi:hypothetical protein